MDAGRAFDIKPAGMLALDVARIEAGLLLIEVDFFSSKKALIAAQLYTPFEMGLGRLVSLDKERFVGQRRCGAKQRARSGAAGRRRSSSTGRKSKSSTRQSACRRPSARRRRACRSRSTRPAGRSARATSTTWSPVLKKMIALATVDRRPYPTGHASSRWRSRSKPFATACRPPSRDAVLQSRAEDGDAADLA